MGGSIRQPWKESIEKSSDFHSRLSMDRSRIYWPPLQLRFLRRAVLHAIAGGAGQLLKAVDHQNVPPEIRRKIDQTVASFFELTAVDDVLFKALHPGIRKMLRQHFRSFLRTSLSGTELRGVDLSATAAAHGFRYQWHESVMAAMVPMADGSGR